MYPVLFTIGDVEFHSWSIALAFCMVAGLELSLKRASSFGVRSSTIINLASAITIVVFVSSRFWYIIRIHRLHGQWIDTMDLSHEGRMSMLGIILLALLVLLIYAKMKKLSVVMLGDVMAPVFLLFVGIQRLGGCFLSGCCFGRPTNNFLGIVFPKGPASLRFPGIPLWPTQIFASLLGFAGFALVLWSERRHNFPGYTFWQVLAYYSIMRFMVDQFRYYEPSQILGMIGPLTIHIHHPILASVFVLSTYLWWRKWRDKRH